MTAVRAVSSFFTCPTACFVRRFPWLVLLRAFFLGIVVTPFFEATEPLGNPKLHIFLRGYLRRRPNVNSRDAICTEKNNRRFAITPCQVIGKAAMPAPIPRHQMRSPECLWRRTRLSPAAPSNSSAELHLSVKGRSWAIQLIVLIGCLLARSGSIFESQFGDSRFIELAQAFSDHPVILFLGGARER